MKKNIAIIGCVIVEQNLAYQTPLTPRKKQNAVIVEENTRKKELKFLKRLKKNKTAALCSPVR